MEVDAYPLPWPQLLRTDYSDYSGFCVEMIM